MKDTFYCRGCGDCDYMLICCSGEKVGGGMYCSKCCPRDHKQAHIEGMLRVVNRLMANAMALATNIACGRYILALGSLSLISDSVKHLDIELQKALEHDRKVKQ